MQLDDPSLYLKIDSQRMLAEIDGLPDQLETAWKLGQSFPLPDWDGIDRILVAGMGGSAIGADLVAAYVAPHCPVPVFVLRDYDLPAWARGPKTLLIACSHSGNTEETLSAFQQASESECTRLAITTGGRLAEFAEQTNAEIWQFEHKGQPRAAVGFSFGLLLAVFARLVLIQNPTTALNDALRSMRAQQKNLKSEVPTVQNPAKRQAGQLMGRWVTVMGSEILAPVARRWKGQISELAKAWAQFEALPEADHNTLAGINNPENIFGSHITLFLLAPSYNRRNQLRTELTRKIFMLEGLNTDLYNAQGETRLGHLWTTLHFGDYMAYYLAIAYGIDPTPVEMIEEFKRELPEV